MAAMLIHGVRPGPMIMIEAPQFVYDVVAMMMFATIGILIYGLTLTRLLVHVLHGAADDHRADHLRAVHGRHLRDRSRLFDVWVMVALRPARLRAAAASATRWRRWCSASCSATCWRRTCAAGWCCRDGDLTPFFTRPISAVLWITIAIVIVDALRVGAARVLPRAARPRHERRIDMSTVRLGIVMNGVTGRMGTNQHLRALDLRDPRAGRRRARRRPARDARPDPRRPQPREARGAREGARRRARHDRPRRRAARTPTTRCTSTRRRPACAPTLIRKAIAAGKHVYTEKPVAPTLADAHRPREAREGRRREARRGAGQAVAARPAQAEDARRLGLLRPHPVGARRVRLLGVRGRLAAGAASVVELPQGRRRRDHRRHAVPLALRARQPVRRGEVGVLYLDEDDYLFIVDR